MNQNNIHNKKVIQNLDNIIITDNIPFENNEIEEIQENRHYIEENERDNEGSIIVKVEIVEKNSHLRIRTPG